MIYDPRIATVSEDEFAELMAIVRDQAEPRPLSDDDRWRADYGWSSNGGFVAVEIPRER